MLEIISTTNQQRSTVVLIEIKEEAIAFWPEVGNLLEDGEGEGISKQVYISQLNSVVSLQKECESGLNEIHKILSGPSPSFCI